MKNSYKLLSVLLLLSLICTTLTLVSCDLADPYKHLNDLLGVKAKTLELKITTGEGEDTLTGTYTVTNNEADATIKYTYEEFTQFGIEEDGFVIPSERKKTQTGSMTVSNGRIMLLDGAPCDLALQAITLSRLHLCDEALSGVVMTDTSLTANVTDAKALLGLTEALTQMQLSLTFTEEEISTLHLSYLNETGTPVVMEYTFTYEANA